MYNFAGNQSILCNFPSYLCQWANNLHQTDDPCKLFREGIGKGFAVDINIIVCHKICS